MGKIAVLGLGASVKLYDPVYDLTIGVNDIWKYVQTDAIVCLDHPRVFYPDRIKIIDNSKPRYFYSQIVNWDHRKDFRKITLLPGYPDRICDLKRGLWKSFCSPFVAVQIAYKYHSASEIHLYGVDLLNHPHLDQRICKKIKIHFDNLRTALLAENVRLITHGDGILKNYV